MYYKYLLGCVIILSCVNAWGIDPELRKLQQTFHAAAYKTNESKCIELLLAFPKLLTLIGTEIATSHAHVTSQNAYYEVMRQQSSQ